MRERRETLIFTRFNYELGILPKHSREFTAVSLDYNKINSNFNENFGR